MLPLPTSAPRVDGLGVSLTDKSNMSPTALGSCAVSAGGAFPVEALSVLCREPNKGESGLVRLLARHEEHLREVERKQKQYLQSRIPQSHQNKNA
jgi:mitogen-activated protein kinase kinase kinase